MPPNYTPFRPGNPPTPQGSQKHLSFDPHSHSPQNTSLAGLDNVAEQLVHHGES
jgi:hypothetical protein